MSILRPPGLGPIVGHTTDKTCRVWIRAGDPGDEDTELDENRRTVGVLGLVRGNQITTAWYFRLNREFDRTGTFVVGSDVQLGYGPGDFEDQGKQMPNPLPDRIGAVNLDPDSEYTVRVGTLTVDDPLPNAVRLPDWKLISLLPNIESVQDDLLKLDAEECEAKFRTFPAPDGPGQTLSFLVGSCRYPGLLWKIKDADRVFGPMEAHFAPDGRFGAPAKFTIMCGDQIYADMLNRNVPLMRADTYAEFQQRYSKAFGAPNLRRLLRTSSTYMILDDHEIEDNWTQDRIRDPGKHQVFNFAIGAYMSYQWSHGPRTWGRLLYYTFDCAGYPFFVLDTRTQRFKNNANDETDKRLRDNHLLGLPNIDPAHPGQLKCLLDWLSRLQKTQGDRPKFIVSSNVFVPNGMDKRICETKGKKLDEQWFSVNERGRDASDSWPAFPLTRRAVLERIVAEKIQNVVFLSGDIHCSNAAEMVFEQDGNGGPNNLPLKAFSVTSSAFYWPFPFADGDPNSFVHDSKDPSQWDPFPLDANTRMHYRSFGYTQEDNFVRLDIDKATTSLTIRVFDRDGKPVKVADSTNTIVQGITLQLAPW